MTNDNNTLDGDIQSCSECQQAFDITINNDQWGTTECIYTEDIYCPTCLIEHNGKDHHFYYTKVMERKTQHKEGNLAKCLVTIKKFIREGKVLVIQNNREDERQFIFWEKQTYGSVPKFHWYEMTHDNFVLNHYPKFLTLKGRDESQAGNEAICE